ncbi:MAG: hypothetical protein RL885_24950 [Planctomycetota bacterium]
MDENQPAIVRALRRVGASVYSTAALGRGFPDLCVGWQGRNYLMEVKDGAKIRSKRRLTPEEEDFAAVWRGQLVVVETVDEALAVIGVR